MTIGFGVASRVRSASLFILGVPKRERMGDNRAARKRSLEALPMNQISLEDAQSRLSDLIDGLRPGEELQIIRNAQPVARLVAEPARLRKPRQPGSAVGRPVILSEDDEHLEDFN